VRTVLRRASGASGPNEILRAGNLTLDRARFRVMLGDREIPVTLTEFEILAALVSQPGRVFSRAQLLTVARGVAFESYERAIDSHIRNLRRKLEAQPSQAPDEPSDVSAHILTVHGVGYKFAE
jgi:two-component system alkaline phosphatase synthesis response regulator PhoP